MSSTIIGTSVSSFDSDPGTRGQEVDTASLSEIELLLGESNYNQWQEQMIGLIQTHGMRGFIDGTIKKPVEKDMKAEYIEWETCDTLVKKMIRDTLSEDVIGTVAGLGTANDVWKKLKTTYCIPPVPVITTTNEDPAEYLPLCRAIVSRNWVEAQNLLNQMDRSAFTAKLDSNSYSAIHHAIEAEGENLEFVKYLLKHIDPNSLLDLVEATTGCNPLHIAAMVGDTDAARMLVDKNPHLLFRVNSHRNLPIHKAIFNSHRTTCLYLLHACKQYNGLAEQHGYLGPFEGRNGTLLLSGLINEGLVDVAYDLIKEYPDIATTSYTNIQAPLVAIGSKIDLYYSGAQYTSYQKFVYSYVATMNNNLRKTEKLPDIENHHKYKDKDVDNCRRSCYHDVIQKIYAKFWEIAGLHVSHLKADSVKHSTTLMLLRHICEELCKTDRQRDVRDFYSATTIAAKNNTPEVIEEVVGYFPKSIWSYTCINGHKLIQLAITNRSEKVYNLMVHQISINKNLHRGLVDKDGNNLLHLAGRLAPIHKLNVVSGAALQMQRELQWFQEVEKFVQPMKKEANNSIGETPMMVFRREHKELRKEGEEWMKKTADSYTITAALIITIVFAAAITVPGGNDDNTGKVIYGTKPSFILFAISDAISMFTSTTSLLLFLSILTARYRDEDFLYRLPKRLILGLAMLFLSVTSMLVAFSATLYIMFGQGKAWILIPIAALTCLPITSFVTLQFPLLAELISSTYGIGIFGKHNGRRY